MRHIVYSLSAFALVANGVVTVPVAPVTVISSPMAPAAPVTQIPAKGSGPGPATGAGSTSTTAPAATTAPANGNGNANSNNNQNSNSNSNSNGNSGNGNTNANTNQKTTGNLNGGSITDWNSIWTGGWSGTLSNYLSPNLNLLAPLSVYAPTTLSSWNMGASGSTYGPNWGQGALQYASLKVQSWFSQGQRFSWSFLPLTASSGFSFTQDMRTCVLKQIENEVHISNNGINSGWLNPLTNSSTTQLATDVNYGTAKSGANWLSFIIPFGAPNNPVSQQGFVSPFLGILRSPQFFSDVENNCHIPASNFTVLNNAVQWNGNAWVAPN